MESIIFNLKMKLLWSLINNLFPRQLRVHIVTVVREVVKFQEEKSNIAKYYILEISHHPNTREVQIMLEEAL